MLAATCPLGTLKWLSRSVVHMNFTQEVAPVMCVANGVLTGARAERCDNSTTMTSPVPILITNQSDWWQPYVPPLVGLCASLVVAAVAYAGVVKSNRTNRRSIEAADVRELEKWRRDTVLGACSEILQKAASIRSIFRESSTTLDDLRFKTLLESATTAKFELRALTERVQLVAPLELYCAAYALGPAATQLRDPAKQMRIAWVTFQRACESQGLGTEPRGPNAPEIERLYKLHAAEAMARFDDFETLFEESQAEFVLRARAALQTR